MPKTVVTDMDDIEQARERWDELLVTMEKLGFKHEETAAIVSAWVDMLVGRDEQ